jgi:hypothetical protein
MPEVSKIFQKGLSDPVGPIPIKPFNTSNGLIKGIPEFMAAQIISIEDSNEIGCGRIFQSLAI